MKKLIVICIAALALSGCASVESFVAGVVQNTSSATPNQVTTLGDAIQAADLATKAVDVYATTGHPSKAVATELSALNDGLHAALQTWEGANTAGQSVAAASFNAALQAFNAYTTSAGVSH
jgi:uncharacterized protein YceK